MTVARLTSKAAKARLPADVLKKVEADARWNPMQKTALVTTGPQVLADAMNEAGISGKFQPLTVFALTVASIVFSQQSKAAELERLITDYTGEKPKPESEKKP